MLIPLMAAVGKPSKHVDDGRLQRMQQGKWTKLEYRGGKRSRMEDGVLLAELKMCSTSRNFERGKDIHAEIMLSGNEFSVYVATALVNMYAKCGCMVNARQVFEDIQHPDVVSWTALILGYADNGDGITALELFAKMRCRGCDPNPFTFVAALKACTSLALHQEKALEQGKRIHSEICSHSDIYVHNTLIDMYANCGSMAHARQVFENIKQPNVVSWTALILGYAENGDGITALDLFARMTNQGYVPTSITFVAALKACISLALKQGKNGRLECLQQGKLVHSKIVCYSDTKVQSTLVNMYAKCGCMADARQAFDGMKRPNVVSWNALILGYAENGEGATALDLFSRMKSRGYEPTSITYVAALKACGLLGALESGSKIHAEIDAGSELDVILVTCLMDFYAKCGSLAEAQRVFDLHPGRRDMKTWTVLLAGYSRVGDSKAVFKLFRGMQDAGFRPNGVTFLSILTCCSHAGLVEKANEFFHAMLRNYGLTPTVEHYNSMVDIFGRSNKLEDTIALLRSMPCKPNAVTWTTVLGACRKWKNVEVGRLAFSYLVSLDNKNAAAYVLMAHIYGNGGMWEEREIVLRMKTKVKAWKEPGQSCWTNEIEKIQEKLQAMLLTMKKHGYVPDLLSISQNIKDAEKEEALCVHSEKLAIGCALINTKPGKTIRIIKNLRVCDDCHTVAALISTLEQRTIVCRDASRFHIFQDGKCLCGDFW